MSKELWSRFKLNVLFDWCEWFEAPVTRGRAVKKLFRKASEHNISYVAFLSIILEMRRKIVARGDCLGDDVGGTSCRGFSAENQTGTSDLTVCGVLTTPCA